MFNDVGRPKVARSYLRCNTFMVKWKRLYKASFFIMGEDIFDGSDTYV